LEVLVIVLAAAVFIGPTAYHLYERFKKPQKGGAVQPKREPYARRLLRMLTPVFLLIIFLAVLYFGINYLLNL
jgi:hypothetical protein